MQPTDWSQAVTPENWHLTVLSSVDSTNSWLKRHPDTPHGSIVLAEHQSAGRGRGGSCWQSSPGKCLTFSLALKPTIPPQQWSRFAIVSGLAIAETIAQLGIDARIKWPNDIWIDERKVAGILIETQSNRLIIGIGLNVHPQLLPSEVAAHTTCLQDHTHHPLSRPAILESLLASLAHHSAQIESGFPAKLDLIRKRCALTGRHVTLRAHGQDHHGQVLGISDAGALIFEHPDGTREDLIQAEQIRPSD